MAVTGLDHLVINVADVEASLRFYVDTLGLEPVRLEEWRSGDAPFVSVRIDEGTILDLMAEERAGENIDHFCLVVDDDIDELAASGRVEVERGPMSLFGARGQADAIYVRDPDGNRVELRNYG